MVAVPFFIVKLTNTKVVSFVPFLNVLFLILLSLMLKHSVYHLTSTYEFCTIAYVTGCSFLKRILFYNISSKVIFSYFVLNNVPFYNLNHGYSLLYKYVVLVLNRIVIFNIHYVGKILNTTDLFLFQILLN